MQNKPAHSPIGASSYKRWKNCPGSVRLSHGLESVESSYAKEGTEAHELAAKILLNKRIGKIPNPEMYQAVSVYTDAVAKDVMELNPKLKANLYLVEHGFSLESIHPNAYGTADCVIYDAEKKILIVWDYKHGAGVGVDVESNEQLMYYALGALLSTNVIANEIHLKIAQPRFDVENQIKVHKFDAMEILDFAADLEADAKRTDDPDAPLNPSPEYCRWCPAAAICPALATKALAVAQTAFAPTQTYDPVKLSETLDRLPLLEAFIGQVREFAYGEAMHGRLPPNYKLVQKRATRKWKEDSGIGKYLSKVLTKSEDIAACYTPPQEAQIKSPAQVEKVLPKKAHAGLQEYVTAESSGYKLVHSNEPGEPILLDAKSIFEDQAIFD